MPEEPPGFLGHALGDFRAVVPEAIAILDRIAQAVKTHPLREEIVECLCCKATCQHAPRVPIDRRAGAQAASSRCGEQLFIGWSIPQGVGEA